MATESYTTRFRDALAPDCLAWFPRKPRDTYRVYCDGRDFGLDYDTLVEARTAKARFARHWPTHRYFIRRA